MNEDRYTKDLLREQYLLHKTYVKHRIETTHNIGVKVRLPSIPEDISENIIKFILYKVDDNASKWNCKTGDLYSDNQGIQECKCFTSHGPLSFTPTSEWNIIYFLDGRDWLNDKFILYKFPFNHSSTEWKNIKINKTQTFEDQCKQGRRPRLNWNLLYPQIKELCAKIYEGTIEDILS